MLNYFSAAGEQMRKAAADCANYALGQATTVVLPQTRESFSSGVALYEARPDKGYSLTDCISMIEMRERNIGDVLTHDRHFAQEGFNVLFR